MKTERTLVHRKSVTPWYDTEAACYMTLFILFLFIMFAFAGISVSYERTEFQAYAKIPVIVLSMSAYATLSVIIRLARRYINRFQNRYLKDFKA